MAIKLHVSSNSIVLSYCSFLDYSSLEQHHPRGFRVPRLKQLIHEQLIILLVYVNLSLVSLTAYFVHPSEKLE